MKASLTPHRVSVCTLVSVLVRPPEWLDQPPPRSARRQLVLFLLKEIKAPDGYKEPSLPALLGQLQQMLDEWASTIAEDMLERLEVSVKVI
eukprot:3512384-Pyramimonas_sp.AAC.1